MEEINNKEFMPQKVRCKAGNIHSVYSVLKIVEPYDCGALCIKPETKEETTKDVQLELPL